MVKTPHLWDIVNMIVDSPIPTPAAANAAWYPSIGRSDPHTCTDNSKTQMENGVPERELARSLCLTGQTGILKDRITGSRPEYKMSPEPHEKLQEHHLGTVRINYEMHQMKCDTDSLIGSKRGYR